MSKYIFLPWHVPERVLLVFLHNMTFIYYRSDHLKVHEKIHSSSDSFQCVICSQTFVSMRMLTSHMVSHSNNNEDNKFSCTKCNTKFRTSADLQRHQLLHDIDVSTNQKAFHCNFCSDICLGQESLEAHMRQNHSRQCPLCTHVAVSDDDLSQHLMYSHNQQTHPSSEHSVTKPTTSNPIPSMTKDLLVCPYCFCSDFNSLEVLEIHMQSVHSVKPAEVYTCNYCNAPYKNLYSLHEHMRAVHQNQPCLDIKYPCSLCGRQFGSIETLIQHKRALHPSEHKRTSTEYLKHLPRREVQNKELPKPKQNGNLDSPRANNSYSIKVVENGSPCIKVPSIPSQQESIICEYCNATFYNFTHFQTHMKHHLDGIFWCKMCSQKFTSEEHLETHATSHYLSKSMQYGCTCCLKMFGKPDELQKHLMDIHAHHLYRSVHVSFWAKAGLSESFLLNRAYDAMCTVHFCCVILGLPPSTEKNGYSYFFILIHQNV